MSFSCISIVKERKWHKSRVWHIRIQNKGGKQHEFFYFHTSFWCHKNMKHFWGTSKKCKNIFQLVNKVLSTKIFINQGAQDSQIPGIVMEVFARQGKPEKPWNIIGFFHQRLSIFKLTILISYLLDISPQQNIRNINRSQVGHQHRLHAFISNVLIEWSLRF